MLEGTIQHSGVNQNFSWTDRRLSDRHLPSTVPALITGLDECRLDTARMNNGHVPQVHPPTMIDSHLGSIAWHCVGDCDPHTGQPMYLPQREYSAIWSTPSVDCERSADIGVTVHGTYHHAIPVQHPDVPQTTSNVTKDATQQTTYSEPLEALRDPTFMLIDQRVPPTTKEVLATSQWSTVAPETHVSLHPHSFSRDPRQYPQSLVLNHPQSGINTHLWSQSAYASPQHPSYAQSHTSIISAPRTMANQTNSTHIDSQRFRMRYAHRGHA